jgi:hypothetical protein
MSIKDWLTVVFFEKVKRSELPSEVKTIDTTWAMKKESSGTVHGRVNV